MKQGAVLVMVLAVLLFSHSALAEIEFQPGELMAMDEIEDQGLPSGPLAASPTIVPLQIYTHPTSNVAEAASPWVNLDQAYYTTVALRAFASGDFYTTITITDMKSGRTVKIKRGPETISEGMQRLTYGPAYFSGDASALPRIFKITYSYKFLKGPAKSAYMMLMLY